MSNGKPKEKKVRIFHKLKSKYRLVIMNDETLEEKFSFLLSPLNLFTWGGAIIILFFFLGIIIIAFTPLREYIPGYADFETKKKALYAALKADSLEKELTKREAYLLNIKQIIEGKNPGDSLQSSKKNPSVDYSSVFLKKSTEDSVLRAQIESEDKYNLLFYEGKPASHGISSFFFFTPIRGLVSSSFNAGDEHYGVDIIAQKNEAIKAALDGTVILSSWTPETGNVIQLQHENNLISIYKHNSVLLKKTGEKVKAGEAIAIIGESGELSTGPHLHFELWYNGNPIDPQDYMIF